MQEIAGGDNNRTPVIFEVPDNLNFVVSTVLDSTIFR
jgi:hypothetical protein